MNETAPAMVNENNEHINKCLLLMFPETNYFQLSGLKLMAR